MSKETDPKMPQLVPEGKTDKAKMTGKLDKSKAIGRPDKAKIPHTITREVTEEEGEDTEHQFEDEYISIFGQSTRDTRDTTPNPQ